VKLFLGLAIAGLCMVPAFAAEEGGAPTKYQQEFLKHWSTAKALATAVAEAMPAGDYGFKPNPDEMSFGEQIVHIANANYNYCSTRLTGAKSPFQKPATIDKPTALKVLGESFDYCTEAIQGLKDLDGPGKPMSAREAMLGLYAHMAHHRGQAEVYLRVKGIKPPDYKF
jgi:uncharacterized damage-inducible protein DinB